MSTYRLAYADQGSAAYKMEPNYENAQIETFLWRLLMLSALAYFVWNDHVSINIEFFSVQKSALLQQAGEQKPDKFSMLGGGPQSSQAINPADPVVDKLRFVLAPTFLQRFGIENGAVKQQRQQCQMFIKQFSPVAIAEMRQFGVPASILLAQAMLASEAGSLDEAVLSNNFFLRTCTEKACEGEHQELEKDEAGRVRYEVYDNLWGSFRDQSLYFQHTAPYANLIAAAQKDSQSWIQVLDSAAYSKDEAYGAKLQALVDAFQLEKFDKRGL